MYNLFLLVLVQDVPLALGNLVELNGFDILMAGDRVVRHSVVLVKIFLKVTKGLPGILYLL